MRLNAFSFIVAASAPFVMRMAVCIAIGIAASTAHALETLAPQPTPSLPSSVKAVLTQSKVVKGADGLERLEDASKVKPGEIIEYRVTYTNAGGAAVTGLVANLPIPEGLVYQARSAKPAVEPPQFATRAGQFAAEPLVRASDGKSVRIAYADYRHIRWNLGRLPAKGVTAVTARAQVESIVAEPLKASVMPIPVPSSSHPAGAASR